MIISDFEIYYKQNILSEYKIISHANDGIFKKFKEK